MTAISPFRSSVGDRLRVLLAELEVERDVIDGEIGRLRFVLNGTADLDAVESALEPVSDVPAKEAIVSPKKRSGLRRVTAEMVRDAVLVLRKNPPAKGNERVLIDGYFTARHVAAQIGCHADSVTSHLRDMEKRNIIESAPYRMGKQYRYIMPDPSTRPPLHETMERRFGAVPVAGTGKNGAHTTDKDVNAILAKLPKDQFRVEHTDGSHVKITNTETGQSTITGSTPSDHRVPTQLRTDLRRIGASV